jgi:hypothetical protein
MTQYMDFVVIVYMDQRDVTPWVRSVSINQNDAVSRHFVLEFNTWHNFDESSRWDIFGSYDPAYPRQEILIRSGIIPNDRKRAVNVSAGAVPTVTAEGYEKIWLAKRRGPTKTIIFVPGWGKVNEQVVTAIEAYGKEVGLYRVWHGTPTMHSAVQKLARAAGIRVSLTIPDYPIKAFVVPKESSYWQEIMRLTDPYAPHRYYLRAQNRLVIADKQDEIMGAHNKLIIPAGIVDKLNATPVITKRVRRVIVLVK